MTPRFTVTSSGAPAAPKQGSGGSVGPKKNVSINGKSSKSAGPATARGGAVYLGIDPGIVSCTLSLLFPKGEHITEVMNVGKDKGVLRIAKLQTQVEDFIWDWENSISHVCMESPNLHAKFQLHQMGEASAATKLALLEVLRSPICYPTMVAPIQLKKFVMGSAKARKSGILLDVYRQWGVEFRNDNHADAYALARVAEAVETRKVAFDYQKQVIDRLTPHTERPSDQQRSRPKRSAAAH